MRTPTKLKENYRSGRKELANAIRALVRVRIVSMPSTQVFDAQDRGYRDAVPRDVRTRIAIEAGATEFWFKYVGLDGRVIGLDSFGESAPSEEVLRHFGFNVEHVIEEVKRLLGLKEPLQKCREQAQMCEAAERVARHIK